jgi:quercetin 2,3-dioxygenase
MMTLRPAQERGRTALDWLDSRHSFSFGDYYDPRQMGFGVLRVINDDLVAAGAGFPPHPHRDMEILTYVLSGALEHRDSAGGGSVIRPGDVQRMTAGTGIVHSEFNPSATEPVRLLQIWLLPAQRRLPPAYEERHFPAEERRGGWRLLAKPGGGDGTLDLHADAAVYAALLEGGETARHELPPGRRAWVQVAQGSVRLNGRTLKEGDGAAVEGETALTLTADGPAEALLFDMP